jgi:hypothetical protein
MSSKRTVTCPNDECEADIEVFFDPGCPGKTYGPPERCYPPDPAFIDGPAECPECGRIFTHKDEDAWIERLEEGGSR